MGHRKSNHYRTIHKRVQNRVWQDLPQETRDIIAADDLHTSEAYRWFEAKVEADALRLYEDPNYYSNDLWSFRVSA